MATTEASSLLADHYQKTFELTLSTWEQRNRTFLILLGVVGAAALLTFNVSQGQYAFAAVDMLIALPTLFYFCAYAHSSSDLIRAPVERLRNRQS